MPHPDPLPDLPKRLASRIRSANLRVESARQDVIHYEHRISQDSARIAEFERSPVEFARKYYSHHAVDSYPVQTNMERTRENLEYRKGRFPLKKQLLVSAEDEHQQAVQSVLEQVASMRPTAGRVPWPPQVPGLEEMRAQYAREIRRSVRLAEKERLATLAAFEAEDRLLEAQQTLEEEVSLHEWKDTLAMMSPEERELEEALSAKLKLALEAGTITAAQIIDRLRNK